MAYYDPAYGMATIRYNWSMAYYGPAYDTATIRYNRPMAYFKLSVMRR